MPHQPSPPSPTSLAATMAAIRAFLAAHIARHGPAASLLALDSILATLREAAPEPGLKSSPPAPPPRPAGSRT